MSEKIKAFLNGIGVSEDTQNALFAEENGEDWTVDSAASGYVKKRQALTLNNSDILKELKQQHNREQYPAIVKPLIKKIQTFGGLSVEDMAALTKEGQSLPDVKALLDMAQERYKTQSAGTADEIKSQLHDLQNAFNASKEAHQNELTTLQTDYANKIKMGKVKRHFAKVVASLDLIVPAEAAETLLQTSLLSAYNFDVDDKGLSVLNQDGTKASDGKNFLSAADIIKHKADEFQILKKSNGGSEGDKVTTVINNHRSENKTKTSKGMTPAEAMRARIEAQQK